MATYSFNTMPLLVVGTNRSRPSTDGWPIRRPDSANQDLELPYRLPKMQQAVQWHKYRSQDAGLIWLRGVIREAAAQE